MPYNVKENSLFTEKDKDILEKSGIRISKNILWRLSEERFIAYQALSVAMQKLYISYPLADFRITSYNVCYTKLLRDRFP